MAYRQFKIALHNPCIPLILQLSKEKKPTMLSKCLLALFGFKGVDNFLNLKFQPYPRSLFQRRQYLTGSRTHSTPIERLLIRSRSRKRESIQVQTGLDFFGNIISLDPRTWFTQTKLMNLETSMPLICKLDLREKSQLRAVETTWISIWRYFFFRKKSSGYNFRVVKLDYILPFSLSLSISQIHKCTWFRKKSSPQF